MTLCKLEIFNITCSKNNTEAKHVIKSIRTKKIFKQPKTIGSRFLGVRPIVKNSLLHFNGHNNLA